MHELVGVLAEVNEVPIAGSKPHGRRAALQDYDDPAFVGADVSHRGGPKFCGDIDLQGPSVKLGVVDPSSGSTVPMQFIATNRFSRVFWLVLRRAGPKLGATGL